MRTLTAVIVGVIALSFAAVQAQNEQLIGRWVLNVAKSRYSPGPPPKQQVTVYEAAGKGVKSTVTSTSADGKTLEYSFTTAIDGKDVPVTGNPDFDTVAMTRTGGDTIEFTRKKDGKVVQTATMVIGKDGKTRTVTTTGVNAKGQAVKNVAVYDRQTGSGTK